MTASPAAVSNIDLTPVPAISLPPGLRRVVLAGFMGAGKTSVGKLLAETLGWQFLDLDAHLERRTGMTVPEIFRTQGEAAFRRIESLALANALARPHTVLALGGGTVEELTNRLLLEQTPGTHLVYLAAPFAVLYDRCMLQSFTTPALERPVLSDAAEAERRYNLRHPFYARLARQTVSTHELDRTQVARAIVAVLAQPRKQPER